MSASNRTGMHRSLRGKGRAAFCTLAICLGPLLLALPGCGVELGVGYRGGYPPDAYIPTTEPFYFEGRATYWYGGHWYYRDGGRWNHYDREPPGLYRRRIQSPPMRRRYEPSAGRSAGHFGGSRPGGRPGNRR